MKEEIRSEQQDNSELVTLDLWIERNQQWAQRVPREVWEDLVFSLSARRTRRREQARHSL